MGTGASGVTAARWACGQLITGRDPKKGKVRALREMVEAMLLACQPPAWHGRGVGKVPSGIGGHRLARMPKTPGL